MKWEEVILEDLCIKITDGAHASPQTVTSGMPMASVKDLTDYGINFDSCRMISNKDYEKLLENDCKPLIDDVLISKDGNSAIDTVCIIKKEEEVVLLSSIAILRPNKSKLYPLFLRHLLSWDFYKQYIKSNFTSGAAIPRVILRNFKKCKISLPPLPVQKKIASILSSYDDLIENNLRRIELLEQSARELYKEWFVRFKFPGHEEVKFVDGVPEGWEKKIVKDLGRIITGKTPPTHRVEYYNGEFLFIKTPDMHKSSIVMNTAQTLSYNGANSQKNKVIPEFSIMIACIGAKLGVVALNGLLAQTNQQINTLIPSNEYAKFYSYFLLKDLKPHLRAIGGGATMPNVNKTKFENIEVVIPDIRLLKSFNYFSDYNFRQMKNIIIQNHLLKQARDLLLPRLMRGEIDV